MSDDVMPTENTTPPESQSDKDVVLEARNITKRFPGVLANSDVNFKLRRGEILALLGENGAGKSTLMNIIYGLYQQDEGEVFLQGKEVRFVNPREAIHSGIGMVHQHFQLVNVMSVAENVVLGEERERPKILTIFWTLFFTFVVVVLGYQLTYANSPLFAILGDFMGDSWVSAQSLLYDTVVLLFYAALLPFGVFVPLLTPDKKLETRNMIQASLVRVVFIVIAGLVDILPLGSLSNLGIVIGAVAIFLLIRIVFRWLKMRVPSLRDYLFILIFMAIAGGLSTDEITVSNMLPMWGALALLLLPSYGIAAWRVSPLPDEENRNNWWAFFLGSFVTLGSVAFLVTTQSAEETFQFLLPFLATLAVGAGLFWAIAYGTTYLFDRWEVVSSVMRVGWGFVWRVSLIFVAIWIAGQAYKVGQMGIMTVILQNQPEVRIDRELAPTNFEVAEDAEVNPLAKGGTTQIPDFTPNWRNIEQTGGKGFDRQFKALLAEVDAAYIVSTEQELVTDDYRFEAQSNEWQGLNPVLRDAVEETPPLFQDLVLSLLLVLFAIMGIRSWRGRQHFPTVFTQVGLIVMGVLVLIYVGVLIFVPENLSTGVHIIVVLLGTLAIGGSVYWTYRDRIKRHDEILPINPLDIVIDALLTTLYDAFSVRDTQKSANYVRDLSRQYGLEVDPNAIVEKLPVGLQQRVEIIKALYREADVLILDEPTAVLTPQEGKELFRIMRELAAEGVSIIFITHKLKEVFEVANRIVVMRGGAVVGTTSPAEATEATLAAMMVGREVLLRVEKDEAQPEHAVLEVMGLHAKDDRGGSALTDVSFNVRAGEVLGVAGVQGNGQSELVEVLTGLRKLNEGEVKLNGQPLKSDRPAEASVLQRIFAVLIDLVAIGAVAIMVSYFISYLGGEPKAFKLNSANTIGSFLVIDMLYHLLMWGIYAQTLGKMMQGVQIEVNNVLTLHIPTGEGTLNINPLLAIRYILQTPLRYAAVSLVFFPINWLVDTSFPAETAAVFAFFSTIFGLILAGIIVDATEGLGKLTSLYDTLFQMRVVQSTEITPRRIKDAEVAHVPENRLRFGLLKDFSVAHNLILNDYYEKPFAEAPNAPQVLPLGTSYGSIFGIVFFALITGWLYLWDSFIWTDILSYFKVPERYSIVPTDRALTGSLAQYLNDPLLVQLILLLVVTFILSIIAHIIASLGMRFVRSAMLNTGWDPDNGLIINDKAAETHADDLIEQFDIRTPSALTTGGSLSGGNQQKVVVAREFSRKPRLLIASQPTRGIDVGSIEFIHKQIIAQRDDGAAVLLVSAELDEIMSLADRIAVMYRGEIIDEVDAATATREQLGLLMAGIKE